MSRSPVFTFRFPLLWLGPLVEQDIVRPIYFSGQSSSLLFHELVPVFRTTRGVPENCAESCSISRSNVHIMGDPRFCPQRDCGLVVSWFRCSEERGIWIWTPECLESASERWKRRNLVERFCLLPLRGNNEEGDFRNGRLRGQVEGEWTKRNSRNGWLDYNRGIIRANDTLPLPPDNCKWRPFMLRGAADQSRG